MKLTDLLEKDIKTIQGNRMSRLNYRDTSHLFKHLQKLGTGVQADVYELKHIPGTVIKSASIYNPKEDAYMNFLRLILDHQDNPFFPRIYDAKLRELKSTEIEDKLDPKHRPPSNIPYELIVQMEKLHPIMSEKLFDAAWHIFNRLGIRLPSIKPFLTRHENAMEISPYIRNSMNSLKYDELIRETKNPEFKEALTLLKPLKDKYFGTDLHIYNWMLRLTSIGPQLVIVDPFFDFKKI